MPPFWVAGFLLLLAGCSGYRTTFLPAVAVTEEFTDNVRASSEDRQSDFITSVSPSFTFATASPTRELNFAYTPSVVYYAESGSDLATRHSAILNASNRFSRYSRLEVSDAFTRTDDPYVSTRAEFIRGEDPPPPEDTTHRETREPYYTNTATSRYRYDFGTEDHFRVDFTHGIVRNEDPAEEDSTRIEPSAAVTYWLTPRYGVDMRATYTRGDFSLDTDPFSEYQMNSRFIRRFTPHFDVFLNYIHTVMNFDGETENFQVYDTTVGVDYHLSEATFVTLSGGFFVQNAEVSDSTNGYVARADMARRFSWGALRATGGAGYRQTFFGAENLGFTKYYEGTLAGTYSFTRRLTGEGRASYTHNTYADVEGREDDVITLEASLNYLIRPWLSTSVRVTRRDFDSNVPGNSFDENRITLMLTFLPATPWILK